MSKLSGQSPCIPLVLVGGGGKVLKSQVKDDKKMEEATIQEEEDESGGELSGVEFNQAKRSRAEHCGRFS